MSRLGLQLSRPLAMAPAIAATALLLYALIAFPSRSSATDVNGTYTVQVAGFGRGTGTCTVTPQSVSVQCSIRDDAGNAHALTAETLKRDGYRFRGNGTLGSTTVRISGRIDPPNTPQSASRLQATFVTTDNRSGRIVGKHQ